MASAMVLFLAACGGAKTETTAAETSAESKEETTAADTSAAEETKTAGGTLIVGFDQDFRRWDSLVMMESTQDSTLTLQRKLQNVLA